MSGTDLAAIRCALIDADPIRGAKRELRAHRRAVLNRLSKRVPHLVAALDALDGALRVLDRAARTERNE